MLDGKIETFKLTFSGILAALITALGADRKYVTVLFVLMLADTALGWLKGKKSHTWKSEIAKWGFAGKIVQLGLVFILGRMDWALGMEGWLANIGVMYYGIVEIASIIENVNDGGLATLPVGLVELVRKIKYSAGKMVVERIKKAVVTAIGIDPDKINEDKDDNIGNN